MGVVPVSQVGPGAGQVSIRPGPAPNLRVRRLFFEGPQIL